MDSFFLTQDDTALLGLSAESLGLNGYEPFAIKVGGVLRDNGGLDTDGIPTDLGDDARIYAAGGFDFKGNNLVLPVLREVNGDPLTDPNGKLILSKDAVVVGPNFQVAKATTNAYSNLLPPQIGEEAITVPSFSEVKDYELERSIATGTPEVKLNLSSTPLKNAAQWQANFPSGTADSPIVVRLSTGNLTIPQGATLSHTIVIVEQGNIQFQGNGQVLTNVVLLAEKGSVDLAQVQSTDLRVLAGKSLTMRGGARFGGDTLLASGSSGLTFNGATKTSQGADFVTAFSEGTLTYNGASDTRGKLLSQGDMTFNGQSSLFGTIQAKGNLTFNGKTTVTDINRSPVIISGDNITVEENFVGTVYTGTGLDPNVGDILTWSLAGTDQNLFTIDPLSGAIVFKQPPDYEKPADSDLNNVYQATVTVTDKGGLGGSKPIVINVTNVNEAPNDIALDNNTVDENAVGAVIGNLTVTDPDIEAAFLNNTVTVSDNRFEVVNNNGILQLKLKGGQSLNYETEPTIAIALTATDASNSALTYSENFILNVIDVNEVPTNIALDNNSVTENASGAVIGNITVTDPDTVATFRNNSVTVSDNRFEVVNNNGTLQLKLKDGQSLDYETEPTVAIALTATDTGNSSLTYSENFTINVTDVNESDLSLSISAALANDTGISDSDRITIDPTVTGQTENATSLQGNLNGNGFVDISDALNDDGSFTVSFEQYEVLSGGNFANGDYTLVLKSGNTTGQESEVVTVSFSLDITPPPLTLELAPASDTGVLGDKITTEYQVDLTGTTEPGLEVILVETQQTVIADDQGNFTFTDVPMPSVGEAPYTAVVVDEVGNQNRVTEFFTREGVNGAPEITSTPATIFDADNQDSYSYQVEAIDPDGDELTYVLNNPPFGAGIEENGLLSFTPSGDLQPVYTFTVQVDDGRGGTATQTFTVEVPNVVSENRPPAFTSTPLVEGNIGNEYSYQPTVTDPDLEPLTFSLIEAPQGMTIAAATGLLLWTPTGTQLGDNSVTMQVSDAEGLSDTQTFTIAVQEPTSNGAPFFISEPLTDFALAVPGTATGDVNPELISLSLADGEMVTETVSIALPEGGTSTGGKADFVFVVDESGSMGREHDWLTNMVLDLENALQENGITDNRYSMIGYADITRILNQTAQVDISVFGPGNQLVYSQEFGDDFGQAASKPLPEFDVLADGTYTVVVTPKDKTEVPLEYNFSAVVTDLPAVPLRNVNIPISGTVAPLAEETFTFDAPAGTQIFFDGLSTSADIPVRIVDPDGKNIAGGFGINSDLGPFLLPKAGTYSVIASDIRNVGGDFSFQILEFNSAATEIALDTEITGTIATGFATEVFQFEATGGQQLYFDSPGAKLIGAAIYGPDNQLLGSGGNFLDFRANIPSDGTHTLILRSAIANPIDYSFKLVTPEIQTTTLAIGERVTSSLLEAGEQDLYLIEGVAGQQVVFDGISAEPNPVPARLFSPSGVQIYFEFISGRVSAPFILPESGTYSLVLDAAEGDYSFQLLDVASDSTNITAGIATGAEVNVTFADPNRTQLYRLDGVAGQILDFEVLSNTGSFGGNWRLIGVDNTVLKSGALTSNFRVTLPSDGRYTLLLGESGTPFDMSFRIIDQTASDPGVTNPVTGEGAIAIGEIVSGTIENLADQDTYRFNGNAGQRLVFDGLGTSVFSANATLISPSGQTISSSSRGEDSSPFFLQESGEYTIVMSAANSGELAYPYSFRLLDLDQGTTSVQLDTPVTGSLENGRFIQLYEINGSAGQELFFNGLTNTGTLNWQLLGPNNSKLQNFVYFGFQDFSVVLPDSDNYTLVLEGNSNDPIDFSFEVVTPERELQQFAYGEIITGSLSEPGETDIYQFSGTAGDQIWFDGLEDSNPGFTVSLVSPLGKRILGRQFFTFDTTTPITLSESGTYSLVVASGDSSVSEPGRVTGDYSFQVLEFTPNISLPDSLAGSFNDKDESQVFQFTGQSGQKLTLIPENEGFFGNAIQASSATEFLTTVLGGRTGDEDGYLGINTALDLPFREDAIVNVILVTDEDREVEDPRFTFENTLDRLIEENVLLDVAVNAIFQDGAGNTPLGVDADGASYIPDGAGGFTTGEGGEFFTNPPVPGGDNETVKEDYIDLVWANDGVAWDLNQLREGGDLATSFTQALVSKKAQDISEQLAIDLVVSDPNVTVENLTGPLFGVNPGETASFDAKITGDGLARSFELFFVRPDTGFVLGSIPVAINQNYLYLAQAVDPDGDPLTYSLLTAPDGATIDPATGRIDWTPPSTGIYNFEVAVSDDRNGQTSQTFAVEVVAVGEGNSAPVIASTAPDSARVGNQLTYQVTARDADNDPLTYLLTEAPEGVSIAPDTGLLSWTPREGQAGEQVITVKVVDGLGGSDSQNFTLTVSENQKPVFTSTPLLTGDPNQLYEYDVDADDPEGTALSYSLSNGAPTGMTIAADTGLIQWTPTAEQQGYVPVTVFAEDAEGGRSLQSFLLRIGTVDDGNNGDGTTDSEIPLVSLGFDSTLLDIGEDLNLQVRAVDDQGITSLELLVDGSAVALTPGDLSNGAINQATVQFSEPGLFEIVAKAGDADGNFGTESLTVRVFDPLDTTAPTAELDLTQFDPLDLVIREKTDISGVIEDENLEFYRVEIAPVSLINLSNPGEKDPDYITIAEGTGNIDGILASIDPALYRNVNYFVRIYAQDINGNVTVEGFGVGIDSQTKPGEFALEFTDLTIPLTGIPIEVTRRYSSLDANFQGDFGYGWELGLQDANIVEASPSGIDLKFDDFFGGNSFTVGTRVTLNTPDGRRVGFTFDPVIDGGGFFGARYAPRFRPDPGVYETLEVPYFPLSVRSDGSTGLYLFGFTYNPSDYTLTTRDGTKYNYNQDQGLKTVKDRNGNTLTFTDSGITSSTGVEIDFIRDAKGRITEIIDPDGKSLKYSYDANGNLIEFGDRTNNETTFKYEGDRPHYLTEIIDPLNRTSVRTEYDENGQISKIFDADGNALDINYDSATSRQTVKDPFGNTTTYVFDPRGNVVSQIDALAGVTARTYDTNNNLLSETNPEGNTKSYTYDSRGNKLSETDGEGNTKTYTYNARNDILTETDALGNITNYTYDANGNLTRRQDAIGNVTTYTYGQYGLLTEVVDANGKKSNFSYDFYGNITELLDPTGAKTQFTYDRNGRVASVTDALGAITNYIYDAQGRLIEKADPEGSSCGCARGITKTEYNAAGEKIAEIDALGRRTEYRYSDRGLLIETILPDETPADLTDNPRTKNEYDALDRLIVTVDELGRKTHYVYDKLGRQIEVIYPDSTPNDLTDNPRMKKEYDKAGLVIAEIDELGNRTELDYDKADRMIAWTNALNEVTTYTYDADGRQIAMTDGLGRTTNYAYDGLDRLISTTYANNAVMTSTYDPLGRIVAETDLAGNTTKYEYDALGRLTAVVDALNQRTEYKYGAVGNLIEQKDANGQITQFEYDSLRRRKAMILPGGQRNETINDKIGNLIRVTDFNGVTTTYEYNARNWLTEKSFSDGTPTETFTYTLTGELATVTDNRGVTSYVYDQRDRLLSRTEPDNRAIQYTYDAAGNILSLIVPSGTTAYTYDALNRIDTVIDPDSGITDYTYDRVGNLIKTEFPNGITENQQYDLLNRLTYLENRKQTGILSSYTYTLDAMGNRTKVVENDGRTVEYTYDDLYRLTQEKIADAVAGNKVIDYKFDPVGNRLERIDSVEGKTTYSYDANDRLLEEVLGGKVTDYQYDAKGNLTAKVENGATQAEYEWNAKGELVAVEVTENGETGRIEFEYDHQGIRVAIKQNGEETRFLIDTNQQEYAQVIEEYTPDGDVINAYTYGWDLISQDDGTDRVYYQVDGLGSTRNITDINGDVVVEYTFDAYGNLINQVGDSDNNYLFTGEQFDNEIGLNYNRARYYDPNTGRFISRDPFEGFNDQPITLQDYLYGNVNPVNFVDPSGESVLIAASVLGTLTFAVGAAVAIECSDAGVPLQIYNLALAVVVNVIGYLAAFDVYLFAIIVGGASSVVLCDFFDPDGPGPEF